MAQVTGMTAAEIVDELNSALVSAKVDSSGQLLVTTKGGAVIVAGNVGGTSGSSAPVDESVTFSFASPSTTWTCVHNLNHKYVDVDTVDTNGNEIVGDVKYVDANTCTISWYYATAGTASIQR